MFPSLKAFPADRSLKEACGLPLGVVVRPFAPPLAGEEQVPTVDAAWVPRCESCLAYANSLCTFEYRRWKCSVCGNRNRMTNRYASPSSRLKCAELQAETYEMVLGDDDDEGEPSHQCAYIALVDVSGGADYMELARQSLVAAVRAMRPTDLFGLATVGEGVGVFDLRATRPTMREVPVGLDGELPMGLDELADIAVFLVPVGAHGGDIRAAIEALASSEEEALVGDAEPAQPSTRQQDRKRAFGSGLHAVLEFIGTAPEADTYAPTVMCFLAGIPNLGLGALSRTRELQALEGGAAAMEPQTEFYEEMGRNCAEWGVCVDLFIMSHHYVDLVSLKHVALLSGGVVHLYEPVPESANLPQDIYRHLSGPRATQGLLRLRTSSEIVAAQAYGHLAPDPEYEDIYHVTACDGDTCFAFDLDYASDEPLREGSRAVPRVQLAFSYCSQQPEDARRGVASRKRLRVQTREFPVADKARDVFDNADIGALTALMTQKVIVACEADGVSEARGLLTQWLTHVVSSYQSSMATAHTSGQGVVFASCPALEALPRHIFGLMNSALLRTKDASPDSRSFVQSVWSKLAPDELLRAVYPWLGAYADAQQMQFGSLPLSLASVEPTRCPIFVVDAFTAIVVYCIDPAYAPWPPSRESALRGMITELKDSRVLTPRVIFCKAGEPDARWFNAYLINDAGAQGEDSYDSFLAVVSA